MPANSAPLLGFCAQCTSSHRRGDQSGVRSRSLCADQTQSNVRTPSSVFTAPMTLPLLLQGVLFCTVLLNYPKSVRGFLWHNLVAQGSSASYKDDRGTGTQLSLQRTRHVNTTSLAGLSDKVWPSGQLPVNKISVSYPFSSPDQTSHPLFIR